MPKELVFLGPGKVGYREYTEPDLKKDEVRLRSLMSGISHGTEMNYYKGTVPFLHKKWNPNLRIFEKGEATLSYPTTVGYENVSIITELGKKVKDVKIGDRVRVFRPHRETNIVTENDAKHGLLPDEVSPEEGIFGHLAVVALGAVHDARVKIGDNVAIFGLGAIGLMVNQLTKMNGAGKIFAVDLIEKRLTKAKMYGSIPMDAREGDIAKKIKELTDSKGVDVAIETSGTYKGINEAIRCCRIAGNVVTVGFYRGNAHDLTLAEEWHHNRITLMSSMTSWGCPHRDSPLWDYNRLFATVITLFKSKKLLVKDLITHKISFNNAQKAYALIDNDPKETIKVAIEYT